ncbi:hypothetical protein MRB53_023343 [Persea americana]|uniref:Uncharacterized protein n=1 Tax=Persea americana TaxID=3435 RepID=A0ACC2L9T0_PERAE|nr:hypothetical protein MRB53_023343 [Persea americana]
MLSCKHDFPTENDLLLHRHSKRVHLIPLASGTDSTPRQHSSAAIHPPPSSLPLAAGLAQNWKITGASNNLFQTYNNYYH